MRRVFSSILFPVRRNKFLLITTLSLAAVSLSLSSCSLVPEGSRGNYQASGMVALSRQVPSRAELAPSQLLAFMPSPQQSNAAWLKIDRSSGRIELMQGRAKLASASSEGARNLPAGRFELQHKQAMPSWYAPDSYYQKRNLPVPPAYDRIRYLRGALGNHALFLSDEMALHSGWVSSEEVGGVRVSPEVLKGIFERLSVGSIVEIH